MTRSDAAVKGWSDPVTRDKRTDRVACEVSSLSSCEQWGRFTSVPKAFKHLGISEHADPLKDATAKAIRLIIAQGGTVKFKGYKFRRTTT